MTDIRLANTAGTHDVTLKANVPDGMCSACEKPLGDEHQVTIETEVLGERYVFVAHVACLGGYAQLIREQAEPFSFSVVGEERSWQKRG